MSGHEDDVRIFENVDEPMLNAQDQSVANETPAVPNATLNRNESPKAKMKGVKKVITKGLKSDVWKHMTKIVDKDGVAIAICNYCNKKLSAASNCGTTHLRTHIERCNKKKNQDIRQLMLQPKERKDGKVEYKPVVFSEEVSLDDLANMIVLHEYPLSMVDHHGFRTFASNLQPLFTMVSRNTIKNRILRIYHSMRESLVKMLDELESRVAITTDMWTAKPTKKGFMAITAHFIDSDWVLQSRIVRFIYVPPPHTGEVLTEHLVDALVDLNIDRKLCTVTVDNASSNDAMLDKVVDRLDPRTLMMRGLFAHMRCCAHILNLIVKDGLDIVKKEIEKVRNSVVFWIASRSRIQRFEEAARQLSIETKKSLCLDCPTRWNSTYLMLETALSYKLVFHRLKLKEKLYTCAPDEEDWRRVETITKKLKLFYDVTLMFSATSSPTINEFFIKVCELKLSLNKWIGDSDKFISEMAIKMLEKYDKYWGECHEILGIACVLDPRYKLKLIEYFLPRIHGNSASFEIEKIRSNCYDLLNDYQSKGRGNGINESGSSSLHSNVQSDASDELSGFDLFVSSSSSQVDVKSELDHYLEELVLPRTPNFDILGWWKTNGVKFPTLQKIARDILAIPVTSVASESAFSTSGRLITPHRSRLAPNTLEALMCTQNWLRNENKELPLKLGCKGTLALFDEDIDVDMDEE